MVIINYLKLSKEISYALRHSPLEYGLELDNNGWVRLQELLTALRKKEEWKTLEIKDLIKMIELSDKKCHEIVDGKIRAQYGHSISTKIQKDATAPPEYLYHGTARRFNRSIKEKGLLPQDRQYVHLSVDIETAAQVGKRRDESPVILIIKAKLAWKNGVCFYKGNDKVWLADAIRSKYIEFK